MNTDRRDRELTLQVLEAIEDNSAVTQRRLASRMGIALGMANSYLKRCVNKGLVKIQQAPANRYLYYLTPKGFAEKSRLTAEYLTFSLSFYRTAAQSCAEALAEVRGHGHAKVGLYGISELAEIAALKALEAKIDVVCVCDPKADSERFLHLPVCTDPKDGSNAEAWLLTELSNPKKALARLEGHFGKELVFVPSVLGLRPKRAS